MIHTLWHDFRHWKVWTVGIVLIGLLFTVTQCSPEQKQASAPSAKNQPPEITGLTLNPPGPMLPRARIGIQVNVNRNGHDIRYYRWIVGAGEGSIVSGQGESLITYEAPKTPGSYEVRVELEYEGGPPVKDSTIVEVVPEPTPTSTDTPTPTPTATSSPNTPTPTPTATLTPKPDAVVNVEALNLRSGPGVVYDVLGTLNRGDCLKINCKCPKNEWLDVTCSSSRQKGWVNASFLEINLPLANVPVAATVPPTPTPMYTPTPTAMPTPELLPAPILTWPENGATFLGEPVLLKWEWVRSLAPDEIVSVRVYKEGETELCHHSQELDTDYYGGLTYCSAGKHYWGVAVSRQLCKNCPEEEMWQKVSEPSAERWIYYTPPEEEVWEPEPKPEPTKPCHRPPC